MIPYQQEEHQNQASTPLAVEVASVQSIHLLLPSIAGALQKKLVKSG